MSYTVPVPPKPKKPYYEFDLVAALHKDAAPEARALALLVVSRELTMFAQELESHPAAASTAIRLRKQADDHVQAALKLMPQ
jgi:hypothetical protein